MRRLPCNHAALDVITPESAYWIGFLFADGTVATTDRQAVALRLAIRDGDHVYRCREFFKSEHRVAEHIAAVRGKQHRSLGFRICSPRLTQKLIEYGIRPGSKTSHRPIKQLCGNRDFWRGFVDGDGHIGVREHRLMLDLIGAKYILTKFGEYVFTLTGYRPKIKVAGSIFRIVIYSINAQIVIKNLYKRGDVGLKRKVEVARRAAAMTFAPQPIYFQLKHRLKHRSYKLTPEQRDELARGYVAGKSTHILAAEYGISIPSVVSIIKVRGIKFRPRGRIPRINYHKFQSLNPSLLNPRSLPVAAL